jgi:hypothetical protein
MEAMLFERTWRRQNVLGSFREGSSSSPKYIPTITFGRCGYTCFVGILCLDDPGANVKEKCIFSITGGILL